MPTVTTGFKRRRDVEMDWFVAFLQLGMDALTAAWAARKIAEAQVTD